MSEKPEHGIGPGDAERVAREVFTVSGSVRALPGEYDANFEVRGDAGTFVLKIAPAWARREDLDFERCALDHLAERGLGDVVPVQSRTSTGEAIAAVDVAGSVRLVRLVRWLDGRVLSAVRPRSSGLLRDLGRTLASVDTALRDFEHAAMHRELEWDLRDAAPTIRERLGDISDEANRQLVERMLGSWDTTALPLLSKLRTSVVHNDANDFNVLCSDTPGGQSVTGLIDFGDMRHTLLVAEPAIACAYAMFGERDPLAAAGFVVGGYHAELPLEEVDLEVLFDLICMRLCTSVAVSARRRSERPDNAYLTISERPAWTLLRRLARVPRALATATLRHACGLEPCPNTTRVSRWFGRRADPFANLLGRDLAEVPVLDLSVASAGLEAAVPIPSIGRYGEPRLVYDAPSFGVDDGEPNETRTVHLGIDVFADRGQTVHAPLDGVVVGLRDNAGALDYGPTVVLQHEPTADVVFWTLYGHLDRATLHELSIGQKVRAGTAFARLGDPSVNGGWPPHVHVQLITDMLGEEGHFPGVAAPSRAAVWQSFSPDPSPLLGLSEASATRPSTGELIRKRERSLSRALSVSYGRPLHIVRGRGAYLYDSLGRAFLDGVNNVCHVGHCHPRVVAAGQAQMATLNTNTRYLHEKLIDYATRLLAMFPEPLEVCFFVCSGSEANELALRLARTHTGRRDCVVFDGAYHGNTAALVDLSPYKHDGPGGGGAPDWVHAVPMPDPYRREVRGDDILAALQRAAGRSGPAAFLAESLLGCGGQVEPPAGYLDAAYRHARDAGALCIADEVQTGFGRCGDHFWAFETQGVTPDIVTLGKPIGNGHPIGAVVTTRAIAESFRTGMEYFNTFGGNPVSCAIGLAVLDVIAEEGLQENALRVGNYLKRRFAAMQERHEAIGDVRGRGLFLGVELVRDRDTREPAAAAASYVVERMRDRGFLASTDGPLHNVLKIKPPLVWSEYDAERFADALDEVLASSCLRSG